jgi:archaellum component FlaC
MHQPDRPSPPGAHERARKRGLFSGKPEATPPVPSSAAERIEAVMSAYQEVLREQLEEGLRSIQHEANSLMHEIASEVWRAAGGDKGELRSQIVESLSRDQALRGLIAHTDERFQAIAVRTARLEDTLNMLAGSVRAAKQQIEESVERLEALDPHPAIDTAQVRVQLAEISRQIALAFDTLAERDRAIVESVRSRVREHGEIVAQEATRIAQAMEAYVQHGVEAMGRLAGATEARLQAFEAGSDIGPRLAEAVEAQTARLEERLTELAGYVEHLHERIGVETRDLAQEVGSLKGLTAATLGEGLGALRELIAAVDGRTAAVDRRLGSVDERIGAVTEGVGALDERIRSMGEWFGAVVEAQTKGLAQLVRSDSEALRRELVRTAAERDVATARLLDERLGQVSEALTAATQGMVDEVAHRTSQAVQEQLDHMIRTIAEQSAQALEVAVARGVVVEARMQTAVESMERAAAGMTQAHEDTERVVLGAVDARIASLAKLIRADNETLAQQIVADQDATKQALRAMKELQASLPAEVIDMVEQRFASLAESIERSNEMLAARIDRMAEKIGERYDNDIQIVIDRMGDAMHALASLGRPATGQPPGPRIEIE